MTILVDIARIKGLQKFWVQRAANSLDPYTKAVLAPELKLIDRIHYSHFDSMNQVFSPASPAQNKGLRNGRTGDMD